MTSARETEWFDAGGAIERFGDGRAPVDHQRIERFVRDGESTDVIGVARAVTVGLVVNATEEERLVTNGELVETMQRRPHHDVAFHEVTGTAHVRHGCAVTQRACALAHVIECP